MRLRNRRFVFAATESRVTGKNKKGHELIHALRFSFYLIDTIFCRESNISGRG